MTSDPTAEERACIAAGLRILNSGAAVGEAPDGSYKLSKGIAVAELPTSAIEDEQPLSSLVPAGRRFIGVSDAAVAFFDLSYGDAGARLTRTAVGTLAENTLDAITNVGDAQAEDLVIVRPRGLSAEGLWIRGGGQGVMTVLAANGAGHGEDFIEACRRLTTREQPRRED